MNTDLLRWCSLPPHPAPIERHEISLRRKDRFVGELGAGGLYEAFVQRGDELVYFGDLVDWLTDVSELGRRAVVTRFQLSVRYGEFGRKGSLGKIAELIDIDNFRDAPPGCYSLRPSPIAVEMHPETLRARKSTWARWLQGQGWPVPGWLAGPPLIEGEAVMVALPSAPSGVRTNRAADAETAAGEWLRERRGQQKMTKAAALEAIIADNIVPLSGSAFRRAWSANADPQWKKAGAPKKIP